MKYFFVFLSFIKLSFSNNECNRDSPILKDNQCQLIYCTEEQFSTQDCSKNNSIIKTQWLNNIVVFNNYSFRFGSFAINSKGDMIFECSVEENNGIRLFYGLKKDGSYFFKNENGERIPTKIIIIKDNCNNFFYRYESSNIFISINENKECLLSISLYTGNAEIYDFEAKEESFVSTYFFTGYNIESTSCALMEVLDSNNNRKEYFYAFNGRFFF